MAGNHERLNGRNGQIWRDYVRKNMTQAELAEEHGLSQQHVSDILAKVRKSIQDEAKPDLVAEEVGFLRDVRAQLVTLLDGKGAPVTAGKDGEIVIDPETGQPVRDYTGHIRAAAEVRQYAQRLHALLGLDAVVKAEVDVNVTNEAREAGERAMARLAEAEGSGNAE